MKRVVLASQSPRRKALLEALGLDVEVRVSSAEEIMVGEPRQVVLTNAAAKRDEVAAASDAPEIIVAADTIVVLGETIQGKPADSDEARDMLSALSGKTHRVMTGVAVVDTDSGRSAEDVETTEVTFCSLTPEEIDTFIEAVNPVDRAGAYTVDGPGSLLVERYAGCYQNVLGLPMVCLNRLFKEIGDDLFRHIDKEKARFL